jgi:hypothetical protein
MISPSLNKTEQNIGAFISFLAMLLLSLYLIFSTVGMRNEIVFLILFGASFIGELLLCILLLKKYRKESKSLEIDYLNVGVQRHILGLFMIFYGLPKLFGTFFDYQLFALDSKLHDVSEFELAWYYFGKNKWQELFAGVMEFIPGLLLLNRRTYYVGALVLLPVTAQVFILNFFFKIGGVTLPAAIILLACNGYIIYSQKEKIIQFFNSLDFKSNVQLGKITMNVLKIGKWAVIALAVLVVFRNIKSNFFKSGSNTRYEKLIGIYSLESVKKNQSDYIPTTDSLVYKDLYFEKQKRWNILRNYKNETEAFVLDQNENNDSITLYINKGGIGDSPDILDSLTALKGAYRLDGDLLTIFGRQLNDTLELKYKRRDIKPKEWFW